MHQIAFISDRTPQQLALTLIPNRDPWYGSPSQSLIHPRPFKEVWSLLGLESSRAPGALLLYDPVTQVDSFNREGYTVSSGSCGCVRFRLPQTGR